MKIEFELEKREWEIELNYPCDPKVPGAIKEGAAIRVTHSGHSIDMIPEGRGYQVTYASQAARKHFATLTKAQMDLKIFPEYTLKAAYL